MYIQRKVLYKLIFFGNSNGNTYERLQRLLDFFGLITYVKPLYQILPSVLHYYNNVRIAQYLHYTSSVINICIHQTNF